MTPEQRRLVRESFEVLRDQGGPVALLFYGRLFELDPSARRLFHNDLKLQGQKLVDTLETVVQSLDRFDAIRPRLADLGRLHAGYGVRLEQYDMVITALLWALGQALGTDFDPLTRDAWKQALTAVTTAMRDGARLP